MLQMYTSEDVCGELQELCLCCCVGSLKVTRFPLEMFHPEMVVKKQKYHLADCMNLFGYWPLYTPSCSCH